MSTPNRDSYHHGQLRQTLLALAHDVVERDGAEALSLRALADSAGVSRMAPYRHFEDRSALLQALAEDGFADLRGRLASADDADPHRALTAFAGVYVQFALDRPGLFRLMYGSKPPTPDAGQASDSGTVLGLVSERLAAIVPPGRLDEARLASWSLVHGLATLAVTGRIRIPPKDLAATAEKLVQILLRGLD